MNEEYFKLTIPAILKGTKTKILREIATQEEPNISSIALKLKESTPNIAFHLNGSIKTKKGLVELGLVEKAAVKKGRNILKLTELGHKALEIVN